MLPPAAAAVAGLAVVVMRAAGCWPVTSQILGGLEAFVTKNTAKFCFGYLGFKSYAQIYFVFARVDEVKDGELKSVQRSLPSGFARKLITPA